MRRTVRVLASLLLLAGLPRHLAAQGARLGAEFQVNTYTTDYQGGPAVATNAAGDFVVVWTSGCAYPALCSGQDGSSYGVFGQRFAAGGAKLGTEFAVNTYTTGPQAGSAIATDGANNFVVVWTSGCLYPASCVGQQDGSTVGVFGQRFASDGARLGTEFPVNTYTTSYQFAPAVAADGAGNFVVVWSSGCDYPACPGQPDGSYFGVFGQRFASNGARLGTEFQVNSYTTGAQLFPAVAGDAMGNFVVVWSSGCDTAACSGAQDGSYFGIFGQRFASDGSRLGTEFQVNTYTTAAQFFPAVATDVANDFVVVWSSGCVAPALCPAQQDGSDFGVFGQRFASSGARLGTEFQVNTYTTGYQRSAAVATDAAGEFVVVWRSDLRDGSSYGVLGQRFANSGALLGSEFPVNTYTTGFQGEPAVAADATGNFVVVWMGGTSQDGSNFGVFGQRFNTIAAVRSLVPVVSRTNLLVLIGLLCGVAVLGFRGRRNRAAERS